MNLLQATELGQTTTRNEIETLVLFFPVEITDEGQKVLV